MYSHRVGKIQAWCIVCYYGYRVTGTLNIDTKATPELLLERNIKLAEKLSTQNKVQRLYCSVNMLYHSIITLLYVHNTKLVIVYCKQVTGVMVG